MRSAKWVVLFCASAAAVSLAACQDADSAPIAEERTAVTSSALTSDGGAGTPAPTNIDTFLVYAAQSVSLGSGDHSVGGDIGVSGAGGSITVGALDGLDVLHTLVAPLITVGSGAIVGAVDTNTLTNNGGLVGPQTAYPASVPPLPAVFPATPGTTNITVAQGQQQTLSPGPYGTLTDNGIVFLNPGTYSFASISLGNSAQLQVKPGGSAIVLVAGRLSTGTFAQVVPAGQPANALAISVSGSDGTGGPAVSLGANTQVISLLAAPNGTVSLGNNVQATGAFAGVNFTAGTNVQLNFQSGFPNSTPTISTFVAYAELSLTLGSGVHSQGGDIGVAAVGAASAGTQLTVGNQTQLDTQHTVYAPTVSLGSQAIVGEVEATTLTNNGGTFGTQAPFAASAMPLLPLALASTPNTTNVTVASGAVDTLSPGSYGTLTDNGILNLNPGTYSFSSVSLGNSAQLVALPGGVTSVAIAGTLSTGTFAQMFPLGQPAGNLTISVAGSDGATPAASIGANAQIVALLNAPHGTLSLGNNAQATGAFGGFFVTAGSNVTLNFQAGFPPTSQQPVGQQQLSGYITPAMASAPLVGPVPGNAIIRLAIGLPEQNPQALAQFIQSASTPGTPQFRQYIDGGTFASLYSPSQATYQQLSTWALAAGFSILNTSPSRLLLEIIGSAAAAEQSLFINLNYYLRPDGTQFYALDRNPSIRLNAVQTPILRISGLNNSFVDQPAGDPVETGSSDMNTYTGFDLRNAYLGCAQGALTGAGQSVGIVSKGGFNPPDIAAYDSANTPPNVTPGTVYPLITSGAANILGVNIEPAPGIPDSETTLDIEAVHALAPAATVVVFEEPDFSGPGFSIFLASSEESDAQLLATIAVNVFDLIHQVSSSYGIDVDSNTLQQLDLLAAQGVSFFLSSGDNGVYGPPPNAPPPSAVLESPWITIVGGTQLVMNSFASPGMRCNTYLGPCTYAFERAWYESGGGVLDNVPLSFYENPPFFTEHGNLTVPIPGYQSTNIVTSDNDVSYLYRNIPDVSALAAVQFDYFFNNAEGTFGGTSVSSPLWAGYTALVNERLAATGANGALVGFPNPALYLIGNSLYTAPNAFNDITLNETAPKGSTAANSPATSGYDLSTGLGTPTCSLIDQLASSTPGTAASSGLCCSAGQTCNFQFNNVGVCCSNPLVDGVCCPYTQTPSQCCSDSSDIDCGGQCCLAGACASSGSGLPATTGTCCSGGALAVCGAVCCSDTQACVDPINSICGSPLLPQLVLEDATGDFLAESPSGSLTVFEGVTYQAVGSGFSPGVVDVFLVGSGADFGDYVLTPSSLGTFNTGPFIFTAAEEGMNQTFSMIEGPSSASILVNVEPLASQ
jgi:hypothetical protein